MGCEGNKIICRRAYQRINCQSTKVHKYVKWQVGQRDATSNMP